jgi:dTDP-4-dehydrorhamnose 3,5-epimerase-like enzyme
MSDPLSTRETRIPGCLLVRPPIRTDARGSLVKVFHPAAYAQLNPGFQAAE